MYTKHWNVNRELAGLAKGRQAGAMVNANAVRGR